jgi:WD40 repeat protein
VRRPPGHGRRAISGSYDGALWLWDLESGKTFHVLQGHMCRVTAVAVTPDGRRGISGSYDGRLCLWDLESGKTFHVLQGQYARGQRRGGDARQPPARMTERCSSGLWDLGTGQTIRPLNQPRKPAHALGD